ncbi:MAG: hypothetical protein M3Q07_16415 [Pseudobdellovibrionaceae bacterium]|nr:hypothetical protein [Pseudobdellovibrionaceae bacterium]
MKFLPLATALIATSLVNGVACSKKKKSSGAAAVTALATEASEDTLLSAAVSTGALAINSIDILGVGTQEGASLRLASTDYDTDKGRTNVYDPSLDALKQVSGILCFFNQAAYIEMAGKGAYIAQADMDTCFNEGGGESSSSSSGGSQDQSASKQKNLTTVFVESVRESEMHPLIVKGWFTMNESDGEQKMQVKMVIAEGQNEQNPLGIFKLTWEGFDANDTSIQKGFIEAKRASDSGKISLNFVEQSSFGEETFSQSLASILDYDSAVGEVVGGVVRTLIPNWNSMSPDIKGEVESVASTGLTEMTNSEYLAAFNSSRFLRKDVAAGTSQCLAKDEFDYNVYRYGLYDATSGSRKDLNSGFPVTIEQNGETIYGWAGYWGVWLGEAAVTDGMTVQRMDYDTGATTPYTVKASPGKLMKRSKETLALSKLAGVEFNAWDVNGSSIIAYNSSKNAFEKIGTSGDYGTTEYLATPVDYTLGKDYGDKFPNNFWSQSLGGSVVVYSDNEGAIVGTNAYYYKEENVTGSASNLTLYCYQQCPRGAITSSSNSTYDDENMAAVTDWSDQAAMASALKQVYTFNASTMELIDAESGQAVKITDSSTGMTYVMSGALVAAELSNPFGAWEENVYYTWETGTNSWNQYIALRDANGQTVAFDSPMFLKYTHSQANDRSGASGSKYYDKPYLLTYEGFGNLWGIPSGSDDNGFWKAQFALKDGALLGDSNQYKVKALDMELAMKQKDLGECGTLATSSPELPTISAFKSPNNGAIPTLTGAPSVVEGMVKISQ